MDSLAHESRSQWKGRRSVTSETSERSERSDITAVFISPCVSVNRTAEELSEQRRDDQWGGGAAGVGGGDLP